MVSLLSSGPNVELDSVGPWEKVRTTVAPLPSHVVVAVVRRHLSGVGPLIASLPQQPAWHLPALCKVALGEGSQVRCVLCLKDMVPSTTGTSL